ncbi:hypothetical protein [Secundilactobacillus yichangensis]|uniref:hypothetical protein n=1 Tax=Secundilactobacillus yichangensis TaxID=2799580 RepID=UPI001945B763|nr:hypothetical protein [Secundilactobacillus yichangensis]
MITRISITFGTKQILSKLQTRYPDRQLLLLDSSASGEQLALLDVSGEESVFSSPIHYDIKLHRGTTDWQGFINFIYIDNLSPDDQKVFNSKANHFVTTDPMPVGMRSIYFMKDEKNRSNNIILSTWEKADDFSTWKRDNSFKPFNYFVSSQNNYHEASYHFFKPENE